MCKREWFWVLCFYLLFKWNFFSTTNFTFIQLCFGNMELILNFQRWKLSISNFLKIIFKVFILDWRRHYIKHMHQKTTRCTPLPINTKLVMWFKTSSKHTIIEQLNIWCIKPNFNTNIFQLVKLFQFFQFHFQTLFILGAQIKHYPCFFRWFQVVKLMSST
jgi:hypothetical protein